jgi:hypothetical protein
VGCVYGDSTPFHYGGNFIETIRHAVDCGVALMAAQHTIVRAGARAHEIDRARQAERVKLEAMAQTVRRSVSADATSGAERLLRTSAQILDATRLAVEGAVAQLETIAAEELAKSRASKEVARTSALRAVESFLLRHDLPGSHLGLRLLANDSAYGSHALVATPFGVEAIFELLVPAAHEWGKLRQVRDLAAGVEVHLPLEAGLIWKRVEVQSVKLDKLYLSSVHLSKARSVIALRKQPRGGAGYKLEFDATRGSVRVTLHALMEDGTESPEPPRELAGPDAVHVLRLWQRVVDSTADLPMRRSVMTSAVVDGRAIQDLDEPQLVCERLVRTLAPTLREIAKRSGAPGELVLRRDVRAGRRDEVYITKAELHEKVLTLPPALRTVFDPFELDAERSPRAPAPSLPAYDDLEDDDVEVLGRPTPPLLPPASHRPSQRPSQRASQTPRPAQKAS